VQEEGGSESGEKWDGKNESKESKSNRERSFTAQYNIAGWGAGARGRKNQPSSKRVTKQLPFHQGT